MGGSRLATCEHGGWVTVRSGATPTHGLAAARLGLLIGQQPSIAIVPQMLFAAGARRRAPRARLCSRRDAGGAVLLVGRCDQRALVAAAVRLPIWSWPARGRDRGSDRGSIRLRRVSFQEGCGHADRHGLGASIALGLWSKAPRACAPTGSSSACACWVRGPRRAPYWQSRCVSRDDQRRGIPIWPVASQEAYSAATRLACSAAARSIVGRGIRAAVRR